MEATAIFDLYYLFVENVFGSVLLSGIGLVILFIFIGILSRMNPTTIVILVGFFIAVFSIGYLGELGVLLLSLIALFYFFRGLHKWITNF